MSLFGIRARLRALAADVAAAPALRNEIERLRVQLAGVTVAARGGTSADAVAHRGQYGWSMAYQDVLDLRRKYDDLRARCIDPPASRPATGGGRGEILEVMLSMGGLGPGNIKSAHLHPINMNKHLPAVAIIEAEGGTLTIVTDRPVRWESATGQSYTWPVDL